MSESDIEKEKRRLVQEVSGKIQNLKNDLMNLSMEARLSIELEIRDNKDVIEQLSSSIQSLTEKYQELNGLYVTECERRRCVFLIIGMLFRYSMNCRT